MTHTYAEQHPHRPEQRKFGTNGLKKILGGIAVALAFSSTTPSESRAEEQGGYQWDKAGFVDLSSRLGPYSWGYESCLSGLNCNVSVSMNGKQHYYRDKFGYDIKNCTSYAASRAEREFGASINGWGNATNWDEAATGKYTVDNTPEAGDLAVWDGAYGHVAFVESVNSDGSINISEYNHDQNGNFSQRGLAYNGQRLTAPHYIDINGTGVHWNDGSGGSTSYNSVAEGQEFYTSDGWIYTKVGGSAWPIKNQGWTPEDDIKWGGHPVGPVPKTEVHNHEVGYDANGRNVGAHAPRAGTDVFVDGGNGQQYYFVGDKAFEIGPGEIDDLNVRDKAQRIPAFGERLADFTQNRLIDLPNGTVYRFAGDSRVNQMIYHPNGSRDAYYVNNDTLLSCLGLVQYQPVNILPQSSRYYVEGYRGIPQISTPATCAFPPGMVLRGPSGLEQWRITGDNSDTSPYVRHYYPGGLLTYLHTSGNPNLQTLRSVGAINNIAQGADMAPPEGQFFRDASSGQVFKSTQNQYRPVSSPDMLACLGNPSIINVPGEAMIGMPQGSPMSCSYENRIVVRPNGQAYYIKQSRLYAIANPAVRDCIIVRESTGSPASASDQTVDSYINSGEPAHCTYEKEVGLNFVKENGTPTVWLVRPDGTKQHVGSLCVPDAYTTVLKKFHVFNVPTGETAGHKQGPEWWASNSNCAALPG